MTIPSTTPKRCYQCDVGVTLVEVMVYAAIMGVTLSAIILGFLKSIELSKYQSAYQTSVSYAEQALEYALYTPYADFSVTNNTQQRYVSTLPTGTTPGIFYSKVAFTNSITTVNNGALQTIVNVTKLATESNLPLDDLGSYVTDRTVLINKPSGADTNLDYAIITVSNSWTFLNRSQLPVVLRTIRISSYDSK